MPSKGQRIPPPNLNRASAPSSQQVYRPPPPAPEKPAATSKAAAKAPATPTTTVTGYPTEKNQRLFEPPLQDNLAKETKPKGKGPIIPHGSRRS
ncbi:unnamed protein product [Urochloa humidicola]